MTDKREKADKLIARSAALLLELKTSDYNTDDFGVLQTLHAVLHLLTAHTLLLQHIIDCLPEEEE